MWRRNIPSSGAFGLSQKPGSSIALVVVIVIERNAGSRHRNSLALLLAPGKPGRLTDRLQQGNLDPTPTGNDLET
jgi:hypothetical protein